MLAQPPSRAQPGNAVAISGRVRLLHLLRLLYVPRFLPVVPIVGQADVAREGAAVDRLGGLEIVPDAGRDQSAVSLSRQAVAAGTSTLVRGRRSAEHLVHVGDAGGIPAADILVERRCTTSE